MVQLLYTFINDGKAKGCCKLLLQRADYGENSAKQVQTVQFVDVCGGKRRRKSKVLLHGLRSVIGKQGFCRRILLVNKRKRNCQLSATYVSRRLSILPLIRQPLRRKYQSMALQKRTKVVQRHDFALYTREIAVVFLFLTQFRKILLVFARITAP